MRAFVAADGTVGRSRRKVSHSASVQDEDVKDPQKLAELLRLAMARISELEGQVASPYIEFEREIGSIGATVELCHNLGGPVRYWVVYWTKVVAGSSYPAAGPVLVVDAASTSDVLVLKSYTAGRAIIRVELAPNGIGFGDA